MALEPSLDFATKLAADMGGSYTFGTNVFAGPKRPFQELAAGTDLVPHAAVFCMADGGPPPGLVHPGGDEADVHYARVRCLVRSDVSAFEAGRDLANLVRQTANKMAVTAVVGGTEYIDCVSEDSAPNYLGRDDTEHHEWTVNFLLTYEEA